MSKTKIVLIGAGSAEFGQNMLRDAVQTSEIEGSTLALVDVDEKKLKLMKKLADIMVKESGAKIDIEVNTNRKEALPGAEFIIISIAVERYPLWKKDFEIPWKYGIRQVIGECGGPGGFFHTCRNVPILLDICRDVEDLCPNALVINFTNPENRLVLAINRYTKVKAIGLCHGILETREYISKVLNVKPEDLDVKACGLNHFTWIKDIRFKDTGEDAYPLLREKLPKYKLGSWPTHWLDYNMANLTQDMFKAFGLFPSPGDNHIGEYVPYGWDRTDDRLRGLNWMNFVKEFGVKREQRIHRIINGQEPLGDLLSTKSREASFGIIVDILENRNQLELAVNIPNNGCISNLPNDAIVEIPAMVSRSGIHGLSMGPLPKGIASMCNIQVAVQDLCIEAAVTGDKDLALQALLIDPIVKDIDAAEKTLDELLEVNKPYLPQFK